MIFWHTITNISLLEEQVRDSSGATLGGDAREVKGHGEEHVKPVDIESASHNLRDKTNTDNRKSMTSQKREVRHNATRHRVLLRKGYQWVAKRVLKTLHGG
jgi:hypothetical protein